MRRGQKPKAVIALWQNTDNRVRPHSLPSDLPPARVTFPDLAFRRLMAAAMQEPLARLGL